MAEWWTDFDLPSGPRVLLTKEVAELLLSVPEDILPQEQKEMVVELKKRKEMFEKDSGLGDTIARVTEAIGIQPCGGCKKRQEALNRLFPYRR